MSEKKDEKPEDEKSNGHAINDFEEKTPEKAVRVRIVKNPGSEYFVRVMSNCSLELHAILASIDKLIDVVEEGADPPTLETEQVAALALLEIAHTTARAGYGINPEMDRRRKASGR